MIRDIATTFGGNLVFDGQLRFEDRKLVTQTWIGPLTGRGAQQFGYSTDMNATYIARHYVEAVGGDLKAIVELFASVAEFCHVCYTTGMLALALM